MRWSDSEIWEMPSSGDEERKISSQRGLDVHTPEAGEKPSKNDVMEAICQYRGELSGKKANLILGLKK